MRSAPLSGTACVGRGGYDRPSPLEKGAVAAEGGGWGFLLFCRGCGDGPKQRNPPSRLRRATSLFKGGFWRADIVRPYEWMHPMSEKRRAGLGPAPTKERAESSRPTGMGCTPKIAGRGRELYVSIHLFPKIVPRRAKKRSGCIIGYTLTGFVDAGAGPSGGGGESMAGRGKPPALPALGEVIPPAREGGGASAAVR